MLVFRCKRPLGREFVTSAKYWIRIDILNSLTSKGRFHKLTKHGKEGGFFFLRFATDLYGVAIEMGGLEVWGEGEGMSGEVLFFYDGNRNLVSLWKKFFVVVVGNKRGLKGNLRIKTPEPFFIAFFFFFVLLYLPGRSPLV